MGYTTDFDGSVTIEPPLNEHELAYLEDFSASRRMDREEGPLYAVPGPNRGQYNAAGVRDYNRPPVGQPGLWCQWVSTRDEHGSPDGLGIEWDGGEKFYEATAWMVYLIDHLFSPAARAFVEEHQDEDPRLKHFTCDHVINGTIDAQGEDPDDRWRLIVADNVVTELHGEFSFDAEKPPRGLTFTRKQVESWVGHALTDEQVEALEKALPNSSFPQCVEAVAHEGLGFDDFREI